MVSKRILTVILVSIIIIGSVVAVFVVFHPSDTTDPLVTIVSPVEGVYDNSTQLLEIVASDNIQIDSIWYNWEGVNVTYTGPTGISFPEETIIIRAWAEDTAGNIGSTSAKITILSSSELFVSNWNTTLISAGSSDYYQVRLPLEEGGTYLFLVDWGDGLSDTINTWNQPEVTHSYASAGIYTIRIGGTLLGWRFNNDGDRLKLVEISQWGQLRLGNSGGYFFGCSNLNLTANDSLNLTGTTSLSYLFSDCERLGTSGNMNGWDVSSVTDMSYMFYYASTFNQDISAWDVSSVKNMRYMFHATNAFNQDISAWDVSSVTDMSHTFYYASAFNHSIGAWDVSSVTDMSGMFHGASVFNQDISAWDVSSVTDMSYMFYGASVFNKDISAWDVSSVTDMSFIFRDTYAFNQDISAWDVSSVTDMSGMFHYASVFNQDISAWDVSSVTDMSFMFRDTHAFNQDISTWDVSSVTDMSYMFYGASVFNQDISAWDVSSVTDMSWMFFGVTLSTANYDSLLLGWSLLTLQYGVNFHGGGSKYSAGAAARQYIIDTFGWIIQDSGQSGT